MNEYYGIVNGTENIFADEGYYDTLEEAIRAAESWAESEPQNIFYVVKCSSVAEVFMPDPMPHVTIYEN